MSEDDRAAKAARAKAMLKKRQKKAADSAATAPASVVASSIVPARTFSPSPLELVEADAQDLGDVFSKDSSDTSWLSSLPRKPSSSPPPHLASTTPVTAHVSKSPPQRFQNNLSSLGLSQSTDDVSLPEQVRFPAEENASLNTEAKQLSALQSSAQQLQALLDAERKRVEELTGRLQQLQEDTDIALQNERQTVSLLVTEKTNLTVELERREKFESMAQTLDGLLKEEKLKSDTLSNQVQKVESGFLEMSERARLSEITAKELGERCRDQERQLQLANASASESRKDAEDSQRKLRELEEQIHSDDRVERLEASLKHTQDRADELEYQLSKLKQTHTSLKAERDALNAKCEEYSSKENEWNSKATTLNTQLTESRGEISQLLAEKENLSQAKSKLQTDWNTLEHEMKELREKILQAASTITNNTRQLQAAQSELRTANRRADDAEKMQRSLQAEGTNLMQNLNEMRPKIVELTTAKLDLAEKVHSLDHTLQAREATIAQLESELDEVRDGSQGAQKALQDKLTHLTKDRQDTQRRSDDLQNAYNELQEELNTALVSLRSLEAQRTNQHQEASRRMEEQEHLMDLCHTQEQELVALRTKLEHQLKAHDEEREFLDRAQNEIEILRAQLQTRDTEIEQLREAVNSPSQSDVPRSLDDEMLSSIRQQHALDLSAATSQIRALEETIFNKDTALHALQKKVNMLEEQSSHLLSHSRLGQQRPFSPSHSRPASRALDHDMRRSSFGSHRPSQPPLSRSVFENNMTPETIHKRKVSLSMLKARIDSEVVASSEPSSRALSPVQSESNSYPSSMTHAHHVHRPQLDESHVFWCHSCEGDLVIL